MASHKRPAKWMQHNVDVDYHSVIGGPVTEAGLRIESGPHQLGRGGPWVVWLKGKSGCVSIEAITRASPSEHSPFWPAFEVWIAARSGEDR